MNRISKDDFGMNAALNGLKERGYYPDVVFDIGASDGSWTRSSLRFWPESVHYCFEPLDERQASLNKLKAEFEDHVHIIQGGLGDEDTELSLGITDSHWDSSFAYSGQLSRTVPVHRLDTLLENGLIVPPSFMKLDVQGFERKVIEGGRQTISRCDVALLECQFFRFCESMCTLDVMIRFMSDLGFVPYEFVDFLRRPLDNAMGQCDILFVKRDCFLVSNSNWG